MTEPNDRAFPVPTAVGASENGDGGVTKREYFAGIALAAIYSNQTVCEGIRAEWEKNGKQHTLHFLVAAAAIAQGDTLIRALNHHEHRPE